MAVLVARANGNLTDAATWALAHASQIDAQNSNSVGTTQTLNTAFTVAAGVIDGVCIGMSANANTALNTLTGTVTVHYYEDGGTTPVRSVTVNVSDLQYHGMTMGALAGTPGVHWGWAHFKFATPFTSAGSANARIGVVTNGGTGVHVLRNGTNNNWCYILVGQTQQAPATGDSLFVLREATAPATATARNVTMNNANTTMRPALIMVGLGAKLAFNTAAAANPTLNMAGDVFNEGTFEIGNEATPIPISSTAKMLWEATSDLQYAFANSGVLTMVGSPRTASKLHTWCLTNADCASGATSIPVDRDTGWKAGDEIVIASTSAVNTEFHKTTLASDATSTTLTLAVGLAHSKLGNGVYRAEIINLTRNIEWGSNSTFISGKIWAGRIGATFCMWTQLRLCGSNVAGTDWKRSYLYSTVNDSNTTEALTQASYPGAAFKTKYCAFHTIKGPGFIRIPLKADDIHYYDVWWNVGGLACIQTTGKAGDYTFEGIVFIANPSPLAGYSGTYAMRYDVEGNTLNCRAACFTQGPWNHWSTASDIENGKVFEGNVSHSNNGAGFGLQGVPNFRTYKNLLSWHNQSLGYDIGVTQMGKAILDGCDALGNGGTNYLISNGQCLLKNCKGSSSPYRTLGLNLEGNLGAVIFLEGVDFSPADRVAVTQYDINFESRSGTLFRIYSRNSRFGGPAGFRKNTYPNLSGVNQLWTSHNHNNVVGDHRWFRQWATGQTDTIITNGNSPSERVTPSHAVFAIPTSPKMLPVEAGQTPTISVSVRASTTIDGGAFNGTTLRLVQKANVGLGLAADVVLDTHSLTLGVWEVLSGVVTTPTQDGVLEFVIEVNGTYGWINIDQWAVV